MHTHRHSGSPVAKAIRPQALLGGCRQLLQFGTGNQLKPCRLAGSSLSRVAPRWGAACCCGQQRGAILADEEICSHQTATAPKPSPDPEAAAAAAAEAAAVSCVAPSTAACRGSAVQNTICRRGRMGGRASRQASKTLAGPCCRAARRAAPWQRPSSVLNPWVGRQ